MNRVQKLDRRYNGHQHWTHRAEMGNWYGQEARRKGLINLFDARALLTQSFGPGCFVEEAWALEQSGRAVPVWGFDYEANVFLRDEALVVYELAKERWK